MRRTLSKVLIMIIVMSVLSVPAALSAGGTTLVLPAKLKEISAQAFIGDTSVVEVEIPSATTKIGSKAFSGCSKLTKVTILNNNITIAADAFDKCPNVTLYVSYDSNGEVYAKQHNIRYQLIYDENMPTYMRVRAMVGKFSNSGSGFQGGDDRLIVRMKSGIPLPDISAYNPISIIENGRDIYFIQFGSSGDAANCCAAINSRSDKLYAELDSVGYVDNRDEDRNSVSQSGILAWEDDDPMGFDIYAPYVAEHQSGSQMIAIIDSGVKRNNAYNHMLSSKSINMIDDGQEVFYSGRDHASQIASVIHGCVGDTTNVKLLSIRAVDDEEQRDSLLFGRSIEYAVDVGANIINISYLFPRSDYVEDALRYAVSQGVKVIIAAGNQNGSTSEVFPPNAKVDDLIVVSGLEDVDHLWMNSNTGPEVTYCAPAYKIKTCLGNIGQGTSFAAPMIAAAYALVNLDTTHLSKNRDIRNTCKQDISTGNKTQAIGYGMPQLHKLAAIKVTDIELSGVPSKINVGDTATISFTVKPDKANDKTISITSSNTAAATITRGTGDTLKLKGIGKGKSTITISANDGSGVKKQFDVQVKQPVTKITVSADTNEIDLQHTLTMKLTVEPSNADNRNVKWSSSKENVATVSQSGVVTPVAAGTTVIRADAQDGSKKHDEMTITVIDIPDPISVNIIANGRTLGSDDTIELQPGKGLQLSAKVNPDKAVQTVAWSVKSVPSGVVTIDSTGYLKAEKAGTAFVTSTSTAKGSVHTDVGVLVQVMPTSVDISGPGEVKVGESITLTATVYPSDTSNKNVTWQCSNGNATISQSGVVTGVANGGVEVTAISEADSSIIGRKYINVKQMPKYITISGNTNIFINNDDPDHPAQNASQLTATVDPSDAYDKSISWSSSNPGVATVNSSGIVTTVAPGSTTITATSNVDASVRGSVTVNVKYLWGGWSGWSDSAVSATGSRQVKTKTQYQSNTKTLKYGDWGSWSGWTDVRESSSDTKQEESTTVWYWYRFVCPYCGAHMHVYDKCWTWAGGCGRWIGAENAQVCWLPVSSSGGVQNWEGTGRIMYGNNSRDRWFYWKDASQGYPNGKSTTGYRYRTRSSWWDESGWSAWQDQPIAEVSNNDYKVEVRPRTLYSYRDMNSF